MNGSRAFLASIVVLFASGLAACSGGGAGMPAPKPTGTPAATSTPTAAATATPTPSSTATATAKPTMTPTPAVTSTPAPTPTPGTAGTPAITGLHVAGNEIQNSAGVRILPHGVDRSGTEYACVQGYGIFDGPNDQTSVAAMASWHINAVRVPLNEDCWLAINGVQAQYSGTTYQNAIVAYVNLLHANGLIAILDLHWNAPGTQSATGQEPMADADHAPAFWSSVAATFKNDHSTIFDLYNEPYVSTWSCWLNGGSASACNTSFAIAGMNTLISSVRSAGATNVVMAGGLAYANDLSQWLQNEPTDPTGNLAASWHVYSFNACSSTSCFDSTIAPVIASVPVIPGEIGESDCAHGFIDPLMLWLDQHATGYVGWAWNADFDCSKGPGLITNYDGTPTSYGVGLQSHLAAIAPSAKRR